MNNKLLDSLISEKIKTLTENYATANNTSGSALVDLFSQVGSMRRRYSDLTLKFLHAYSEDKLLATKLAFYTRDIRGGLGERLSGRIMFKTLAEYEPEVMRKNLQFIEYYGRWDDLIYLIDTPLKDDIIQIIKKQLDKDIELMKKGQAISLLAKWLPSINTSSKYTRDLAKIIVQSLNLSAKEYRKTLASLRAYLNVTEVRLSSKDYDYIKYEQVPSLAMLKYERAFQTNDKERFEEYKESLLKGETKINSSVLFPYDIVSKYLYNPNYKEVSTILEKQWESLPNYVEGENNFLIMADVSGSMNGRPMATSIGLAIYFAERNKGPFANKFMTFSSEPELVEVKGETLRDKVLNAMNAKWGLNTDLEAAFELVLNTAIKYNCPQEDMPDSIVIISDMEIDACSNVDDWLFYDYMKAKYKNAGYKIPNIVFWNVDARNNTFHAKSDYKGVQLASGQSASVFKSLLSAKELTARQYMIEVLSNERYNNITI